MDRCCLRTVGLVTGLSLLVLSLVEGTEARAEQCPPGEPTWISGRVTVWEPNLDPAQLRGLGEVYVYAFEPGDSTASTRYMAVSDADGHFCIHDTFAGSWVVTAFEPFQFRPFVVDLACAPGACDLGELRVDESLVRISDDYVSFGTDWWGGPFAQSVQMPPDALSLVKVTFRSGTGSDNPVSVHAGETLTDPPLTTAAVSFPDNPGGGRGTAHFAPGEGVVTPGALYTIVLEGGSAPWRLGGNAYGAGQMYTVAGQTLDPVADTDLCLTLDVDGPDGNLTSLVVTHNDGWVFGQTVVQAFVARSAAVTHASVVSGTPTGFRRIQASVSATLNGPPIGPTKETTGLDQQGVAFAWFPGEVVVTPGQTYYVRFHFPEGGYAVYRRETDPAGQPVYPAGQLYAENSPEPGALWGRILGPAPAAPGPDGGVDDAGPPDASPPDSGLPPADAAPAAADASTGGGSDSGCACDTHPTGPGPGLPPTLLLALVLAWISHRHSQ